MSERPKRVAYGIDIGVYNVGQTQNIVKSTTMHWARVESTAALTFDHESEQFGFNGPIHTEQDLNALVSFVATDLKEGLQVAVGMDAPMWQPAPTVLPNGSFSLYQERIPQERPSYFWYLQSGASATVRALPGGRLLFHGLKRQGLIPTCSTSNDDSDILLYEGFVAGDYKVLQDGDSHANDAVLMAIGFHDSCDDVRTALSTLHPCGAFGQDVLSHWATIVADADLPNASCKSDCCIVGYDRNSETLRNACMDE